MKTLFFASALILNFALSASAADEPVHHLKTINAKVAQAAVESYHQGHYWFIQDGKLVDVQHVDETRPSCILESNHMTFDSQASYKLESTRTLEIDNEGGEIELDFETQSNNPNAYFQIYCFQADPGATLETARIGLKSVFEIE